MIDFHCLESITKTIEKKNNNDNRLPLRIGQRNPKAALITNNGEWFATWYDIFWGK